MMGMQERSESDQTRSGRALGRSDLWCAIRCLLAGGLFCLGACSTGTPLTPTTCKAADSANLLANPGFDTDASKWQTDATVEFVQGQDAEGCPTSGALRISNGHLSQCVKVATGTPFNFGMSYMRTASDEQGVVDCAAYFFDNTTCDGNLVPNGQAYLQDDNNKGVVPWTSVHTSMALAGTAVSAKVVCELGGAAYLDRFFLTPPPGTY